MKTKRKKIIFSVLVVAFALAFSGYLVFSPVKPPNPLGPAGGDAAVSGTDASLDFLISPLNNLTNQFTDQALQKLMDKNAQLAGDSKTLKNIQTLPDKQSVDQIISSVVDTQTKESDPSTISVQVNNDDSKDIQRIYLIFINSVIQDNFDQINGLDATSFSLTQYFSEVAGRLKNVSDILSAVKVPPSWVDIHKQLITFFLREENIYQSLAAAENDPLRYMIASNQLLSKQTENTWGAIKDSINKRIKNEGLI